jgi:hypothetical protein
MRLKQKNLSIITLFVGAVKIHDVVRLTDFTSNLINIYYRWGV